MRHARRAFTLLEVLVAIGIILFLMTIGVLAFRHFDALASRRLTGTVLNSAKSMQVEFENSGQKDLIESDPKLSGVLPVFGDTGTPAQPKYAPLDARFQGGGGGQDNGNISDPTTREKYGGLIQTRKVMTLLLRLPKNVTALNGLPTKLVFKNNNSSPSGGLPMSPTYLLDGWSNPIIFVPRGGLTHVSQTKDDKGNDIAPFYTVRSSGTYLDGQEPKVGPLDRPFWASAGPDGDLASGSDNLYSFQD